MSTNTVVDRVMTAFAQTHKRMTAEQERKIRDELSDFVAKLLSKRAGQLEKFDKTDPRA